MVDLGVVTIAGGLRSCQSIAMAMAVSLAAARGWGSHVNPPDEFCAKAPLTGAELRSGLPVEKAIACLRLRPADRSLDQAVRMLLDQTAYPCEEARTN
jgi:hypothetical protein